MPAPLPVRRHLTPLLMAAEKGHGAAVAALLEGTVLGARCSMRMQAGLLVGTQAAGKTKCPL